MRNKLIISLSLIVLISFMILSANTEKATAADEDFSKSQEEEIQKIIKSYLLENPDVVIMALKEFEVAQREREAQAAKAAIKNNSEELYNDPDSPVGGNPDGDVNLVVFYDYQCGYCKVFFKTLSEVMEEDKDLRVIFKEKPSLGDASTYAAKAALAAVEQGKHFELHMALMKNRGRLSDEKVLSIAERVGIDTEQLTERMKSQEIEKMISENEKLAFKLGIRGIPAIIINDQLYPGILSKEALVDIIAEAREEQKSSDKNPEKKVK